MSFDWRDILGLSQFTLKYLILLWTEFLGTFAIVFTSNLTMAQKHIDKANLMKAVDNAPSGASIEQISFGLGLVFAVVAQALGRRSACHFNPAVTVGFFVVGELGLLMTLLFIVVQCCGSTAGVAAAKSLLPRNFKGVPLGLPSHPDVSRKSSFVIEMLLTYTWVFLARSVESHKQVGLRDTAPLAVGATITAGYLAACRLTGACMNPARSFGPALVYMRWEDQWIYWLAPLAGGILATLTYDFVFKEKQAGKIDEPDDE